MTRDLDMGAKGFFVAGASAPSDQMECRDCYFCDGACVRIGISTCFCLVFLRPGVAGLNLATGGSGTPGTVPASSVYESRAHTVSRAPHVIYFGSTSRDCRSKGKGCAELFNQSNPSENYLAALKLDSNDAHSRALKGRIKLSTDLQPGTVIPGNGNPDNCKLCPKTAIMIFELEAPTQPPDTDGNIVLDADTQLSPELCAELGMKSITIPKGAYIFDTLPGRFGAIRFTGVKCLPK